MESITELHAAFPVVSRNNQTEPLTVSLVLGLYEVNKTELSAKLPVPEVVHTPPVAMVTLPPRDTKSLFVHTVCGSPGIDLGAGVNTTRSVSVTGLHFPLSVEVKTNFIVPAAVSAELGT